MHAKEKNQLKENMYERILTFLQYYFTCYNLISQETSNKISSGVQKYAYLIESDYKQNTIQEFVKSLIEKLPRKEEFVKSFSTLGWSHCDPAYNNSSCKRKVQIALSIIELIKTGSENIDEFTIEHLNQDSLGGENVLIGNLIPLEKHINDNCKDKDLSDKLEFYKKSNFKSVRDFAAQYTPDHFDVKKRANYMANMIYDELKKYSTI